MADALAKVDRSVVPYTSHGADRHYVLPEPALLINTTSDRCHKFLRHWNLLRDGFLYVLTQHHPQLLSAQEWRDVLEGLVTERGLARSRTKRRSSKLEDFICPALEASNIASIEGLPVSLDRLPHFTVEQTHEIVWLVAETDFCFEFCALDRRASGKDRLDEVFVARHVDLHRIPAPLLAVQPAQTASTQPSSTPPTVLLVPPPPTPTPALPVRELEAQEDLFANVVVRPPASAAVFFAAVSSAPASSASPTCWTTVYGAISPSLGASRRMRCCTTSHVISAEEQGVQTHPNTLYATAYETCSKELKNSVPKPKCILSTQVICQRLIEILADTTPDMQLLETAVCRHYMQVFWEYFGCTTVLPMRLEHELEKEDGEI
ncbi:hypothetical protein DFH08DRAFT_963739 [Mycena albidolilacea]|uniref:Uncharacterized protein n=1 Tax=Mycena albidolilacea TaxID=1033008 RepID=A0AAD6ZVA9_9AGAR|nr:hypothetical protein DFH08DRAFT_963739 [Mycena albidolilacea]